MWTDLLRPRALLLRPWLAVLVLIALTVLLRLPVLLHPHAVDDEVNYSVVTHQLMNGGLLYEDAVERRPPATFWVYEGVFRAFGPDNWFALHVAGVVWVLLTMWALYVTASGLFGRRAGLTSAAVYALFQPWWYWGNLAFNGEVLMNLPIAVAYACCLAPAGSRRPVKLFTAGALVAGAFLLKQPAAVAIVPLAWLVIERRWRESSDVAHRRRAVADLAWLGGGSASVLLAVAGWLLARGIFTDALYWSIFDHDVPRVFWDKALGRSAMFALVCGPAVAAATWSLRRAGEWHTRPAERNAVLGLLAVSAIGAAASGRFFPHYYIGLLPALAVLAAPAGGLLDGRRFTVPVVHAARLAVAWTGVVVVATFVHQWQQGAREAGLSEAGRYLRAYAGTDDRVFVWGREPRIYLDAERLPAARFIDTFALTGRMFGPHVDDVDTSTRVVPGAWNHLREDFAVHPPAFVIDTQADAGSEYPVARFPWLDSVLHDDYVVVAHVAEGLVYQRRGAGGSSVARVHGGRSSGLQPAGE